MPPGKQKQREENRVCICNIATAVFQSVTECSSNYALFYIQLLINVIRPNATRSSHVLSEDTIERSVHNGQLHSKRLLTKTNPVPKWGERFYNSKSVKIVEESIVDPAARTLTTYTRNVAFTKVMVSGALILPYLSC